MLLIRKINNMKKQQISYASQIETQINNTLDALFSKKLLYTYNYISKNNKGNGKWRLSWENHQSGKFNTGRYFLKLEQYKKILENNSYLCILYDGSIIRVSYTFENNILTGHNLLWWPAPYAYNGITTEDMSPYELMEEFLIDFQWHEVLKMRSPVRVDYDPAITAVSETHSATHIHMQHENCRMYVQKPLCFNKFIKFILNNYYPNSSFDIEERDYIEFNISDKHEYIEYKNSRIIL
jgi:hypothetical protein